MSEIKTIALDTDPPKLVTEQAYERILPEILEVPEDDLLPINVDIITATTTVIGALPEIKAMRPQIAEHWRSFDFERFDKLEDYTLALTHANYIYRGSATAKGPFTELGDEVTGLRDRLLADAWSLANHGLISGERLKECKTSNSYKAIATDVLTIGGVLRDRWKDVVGKTPVTSELLEQAGKKALALMAAVGEKEQGPALVAETVLIRQKAFTLFMNVYEDARRAIVYLRSKTGDADTIAPSLYAGRNLRRRAEDEAAQPAPTTPATTTTPAPTPAPPAVVSTIPIDNKAGLPMTTPFGA